jgi:hypothetical protein
MSSTSVQFYVWRREGEAWLEEICADELKDVMAEIT